MITLHFVRADGAIQTLTTRPEQSLMQAAVAANLPGIEADCGGTLTCATCHVQIAAPWAERLTPPDPDERAMLEFTSSPSTAQSRLSCQIALTPELDGMVVTLPASQH